MYLSLSERRVFANSQTDSNSVGASLAGLFGTFVVVECVVKVMLMLIILLHQKLNLYTSIQISYPVLSCSLAKGEIIASYICVHVQSHTGTEVISSSERDVFRNIR